VDLLAQRYQGRLDGQADQYLSFAMEGATRMRALIHDLLAYSRLGAPGRELLVTMELQTCLDRALAGLRGAIDETGAAVTWDPLPQVVADPLLMAQLFHNLVGNALKFRGQEAPRIHVGAHTSPSAVQVSVHDNGIGLDPESGHRIFDLFQRLHTREAYPGTGIGLTMCRKIVERHGGRIWVESTPGSGAVFHFTLPRHLGGPP
jgi:light-regulated signal transduction histidine kinase (bacteriophytochrome)